MASSAGAREGRNQICRLLKFALPSRLPESRTREYASVIVDHKSLSVYSAKPLLVLAFLA